MRSHFQVILGTILMLLASSCRSSRERHHLDITSPAGKFRGTVLKSAQGDDFKAFLGIPYARPPTGHLRFGKPQPYPKIHGVFQATQNAPVCIQMAGFDAGSTASEDCLYLNVYTPMADVKPTNKRKVFVYIHGGGFFAGSANDFVPGDWVTRGDVIVVTLNYRLGWLGFVKGNSSEAPGNMGFWDQIEALKWVKDNIRSFGGDPNDITIGGQSAGSGSVSALTLTSHAKDLFTKAVLFSHTVFTSATTFGSSDHLLFDLADTVGCEYNSTDTQDADEVVQCLKQLPAEAFSLPFDALSVNEFVAIEGDLFPAPVAELISDQDYLTSVGFYSRDYINSVVSDEGVIFLQGAFAIATEEQIMTPAVLQELTGFPLMLAEGIIDWYQEPGHFSYNPAHDLIGDFAFMLPELAFLQAFASVNRETYSGRIGNSFFLVNKFTPSYMPEGNQGFFHAMDQPYIFDLPPSVILDRYYHLHTDNGFTKKDRKLKRRAIDTLTEFMKTANPGVSLTNGVPWPAFDLDNEYYLCLTPEPVVEQFPYKERRNFWNSLFA